MLAPTMEKDTDLEDTCTCCRSINAPSSLDYHFADTGTASKCFLPALVWGKGLYHAFLRQERCGPP
jgi:hypothetical protein